MMTYEVVGLCEDNSRTYVSSIGSYSKETGFVLSDSMDRLDKNTLADHLFQVNDWHLKREEEKRKPMTISEIEEALGYKIEIQDTKEEKAQGRKRKTNEEIKDTTEILELDDEIVETFFDMLCPYLKTTKTRW